MGCPPYLSVRTDLHALLAVSHLFAMKVNVAQVQYAAENFKNRVLLLGRETEYLHRR